MIQYCYNIINIIIIIIIIPGWLAVLSLLACCFGPLPLAHLYLVGTKRALKKTCTNR